MRIGSTARSLRNKDFRAFCRAFCEGHRIAVTLGAVVSFIERDARIFLCASSRRHPVLPRGL